MAGSMLLVLLISGAAVFASGNAPAKHNTKTLAKNLPLSISSSLLPIGPQWEWVTRTASVLPYQCTFVYGGGHNRLLYVGRVRVGSDIIPAAIHHYGKGGTETVHYIKNGVVHEQRDVEWLCAKGQLAWTRVEDLSSTTLLLARAVPLGYNSKTKRLVFGCLVHSFYSNDYPPSLGTVVDGNCEFEINGQVVNSKDFNFWRTIEILSLH